MLNKIENKYSCNLIIQKYINITNNYMLLKKHQDIFIFVDYLEIVIFKN